MPGLARGLLLGREIMLDRVKGKRQRRLHATGDGRSRVGRVVDQQNDMKARTTGLPIQCRQAPLDPIRLVTRRNSNGNPQA